jgi:translocation and assembly module TamA
MHRAAALALACALAQAGCLHARGTREEPVVVDMRLEGVHAVKADALQEKLATQPSGRWAWDEPQKLDPDALAADVRRIEAYYRERGYYDARVASTEQLPAGGDPGRVKVVIKVEEGAPIRVSKLTVNGLDGAPEARAKVPRLPLREGDVFTTAAYDATRGALASALATTGWATAEVTQRATVIKETHSAEVTYDVSAGRRWKFGPVDVAVGRQLPRKRILDQVLAVITPGEWFDESKLAVAQTRVFELGAFGGVRVMRLPPDEARGTIAILTVIQRAPFRTIRAGPGLGVQQIRWDAHALVGWQDRNFYGDLRRLDTEVRAGYAWLPNPWQSTKGGTVGLASAEFAQPAAFGPWIDASARLELEKGIEQAYDFKAERGKLSLPLRLMPRLRLVPSYNLEVYQLSNYVSGSAQTSTGSIIENCKGTLHPICLLTYLEQTIAWDGRDDPLNTTRGLYVALSVQEGLDVASYGYRYLRFLPEARFFLPLGGRTVLALRGRLGALMPVSEAGQPPIVARFTAGGPLSMRGYYNRRLSPMQQDPKTGEWVPVGGNGVADGSAELRFGLTGNLGAAVFVDAGTVSGPSPVPNDWQYFEPVQWAAGAGLRYRTPFGPLRIDVASRLPTRWSTSRAAFPAVPLTAYPDGTPHREPIVAVHLSLGEAF